MENSEVSVIEALNQLQSWLNAGEYDKVVQGAQEVLGLEPGNQRALSLLKQAEEKRHPEPALPYDPLTELQVEHAEYAEPEAERTTNEHEAQSEKRKLFLAMLVPAIVVVIVGGSVIWWLANREREDTIANKLTGNLPEDLTYLEGNEQRLDELTTIAETVEAYKVMNGAYPSVSQLDSALVDSAYFEEVPSDPRQGEIDKTGKPFGYIYAVYNGIGGENSVYVLSALFEDSKGFGYAWSKGAPIKNYPDFRDYEEENITFITPDTPERSEGALKEEEDTAVELQEEPSGPKVNPEYQK